MRERERNQEKERKEKHTWSSVTQGVSETRKDEEKPSKYAGPETKYNGEMSQMKCETDVKA
jgi:hypothetical protein